MYENQTPNDHKNVPLSIADVEDQAKLRLAGDDTIHSNGTSTPNETETEILNRLIEALDRVSEKQAQHPEGEPEDPGFRYIFMRVYPDGQLKCNVKVELPTQALQMLAFLTQQFTAQAHQAMMENAAYMAQIAMFNEAAREPGKEEAPQHPALTNGAKIIGSPERPGRQTAVARASMSDLNRLAEGMGQKIKQ